MSLRTVFPYWGPGWYFRTTVAFLLDASIVTWEDVKLSFNAVVHTPASYITERLQLLERMWTEVGGTWLGARFPAQRQVQRSVGIAKDCLGGHAWPVEQV